MPPRVALATCQTLPEPDHDESLLLAELARAGIDAEMAAWDDPQVDWGSFDACVIRSTWNYHLDPGKFQTWIELVSELTTVFNPSDVVLVNMHKSYLPQIAQFGVSTVPTVVLSVPEELREAEFEGRFVIKPAISAGSYQTRVLESNDRAAAVEHLAEILKNGDALLQPFIPSVEHGGEIAWIWIDGKVTHGIRKLPRFSDDDESVSDGFAPTSDDLKRLAPIMAQIDPRCLYARIDVMEHEEKWLLSELELIEPSLFFKQFPTALEKFSAALQKRLV